LIAPHIAEECLPLGIDVAVLAPPNAKTHLPAGLSELRATKSLHAPPVRCSVWFGGDPGVLR